MISKKAQDALDFHFPGVHEPHKTGAVNPHLCPECGSPGRWRRGQEFENEKICANHPRWVTWCPSAVADYLEMAANMQFGDGQGI